MSYQPSVESRSSSLRPVRGRGASPIGFALGLALALAAAGARAQAPDTGGRGGGPIKVQPVQIGPPAGSSGPADAQRAREQEAARQFATPPTAPAPAPLGRCDAGGCWDSQGNRYNGTGDGARFLDREGRLCQTQGKFIHCN